jgi:glycogen phosphorylase
MSNNPMVDEFRALVNVERFDELYAGDIRGSSYFGMPLAPIIACEKKLRDSAVKNIAYFSMEYGLATSYYNRFVSSRQLDPKNISQEHEVFSNYRLADYFFALRTNTIIDLPIYSGGLGVLAGDTVKTMADYQLPVTAVGMLWNAGYFRQKFWFKYGQSPEEMHWDLYSYPGLIPLADRVKVRLASGDIVLRLWKYYVYSYRHDYVVPLILLDSNIDDNDETNRHLTDQLYKSDNVWIKIGQRVILGMGGIAALQALGYGIDLYHMNEGHAVFAFVARARGLSGQERKDIKKHFVYTCHTPVAAGHDRFTVDELSKIITREDLDVAIEYGKEGNQLVNLTLLSMNASSAVNAVSYNHQKVMHMQFPDYRDVVKYVTNGVHHHTWLSEPFMRIFDKYSADFGDVRSNPMALKQADTLRGNQEFRMDLWNAHQENKDQLCQMLKQWGLQKDVFTLCWARRVAAYKRPSLIVKDVRRLISIAKKNGPLQIIFAGKAHPKDDLGFTFINEMLDTIDKLSDAYENVKIMMLENYEIALAHKLTSGVDVWLNNPLPPFEASGTSGMKAILNGVVQVSTLDGWIVEAKDMNIGVIFGYANPEGTIGDEHALHMTEDARKLYAAVDSMTELYYKTNKNGTVDCSSPWIDTMINCIIAAGHFNTYRMLDEYKSIAWHIK